MGLFTDATADEAAYIIDHSDARFVLAQDQEQVDKMLAVRERIPKVERVVYWDEARAVGVRGSLARDLRRGMPAG